MALLDGTSNVMRNDAVPTFREEDPLQPSAIGMESPYAITSHDAFIQRLRFLKFSEGDILEIDMAYDFAKYAHRDAVRKDGVRYFEHVRSVALILLDECAVTEKDIIIAALLHDVPEDSWITGSRAVEGHDVREIAHFRLTRMFGERVANNVLAVTKYPPSGEEERDRENHHRYLEGLRADEDFAVIVKMADRLQNLRSLKSTEAAFREKQVRETESEYLDIFRQFCERSQNHAAFGGILYEKIERELATLRALEDS